MVSKLNQPQSNHKSMTAFSWRQLKLICPHCRTLLKPAPTEDGNNESDYTILTCECYAYPVVADIPILRQGVVGSAKETADDIVAFIRAGAYDDALRTMLMPAAPRSPALAPDWLKSLPSIKGLNAVKYQAHRRAIDGWREEVSNFLLQPTESLTACEFMKGYLGQHLEERQNTYDYFAYRFGQPRHLVALSFTSLIDQPTAPILELTCGCGHITRGLLKQADGQPVVGLDLSFFALYVAKNWVAPKAIYLYGDLDHPLPFEDNVFSAVSSTDGFHYVANKSDSVQEIRRVVRPDGLILINVLRNAHIEYEFAGQPVRAEDYKDLVADIPHRLVGDGAVLERYLRRQGPSLENQADLHHLRDEPLVSLVASEEAEIFHDHDTFEDWPHALGSLRLNPLYQIIEDKASGKTYLERTFPSAFYKEDNIDALNYLPQRQAVSATFFDDLHHQRRTDEIEAFISSCVVLSMPARYVTHSAIVT